MLNLKVLHLLSYWKWTEVSEPAVELAVAQNKLGVEVEFVCGRGPVSVPKRRVDYNARLKNLKPLHVLEMPKHFKILPAFKDCTNLRALLKRFRPDVIHCHKRNAHLMAFLSRRGISKAPIIVRTCYDPEGPLRDLRSRLLYKFSTDGIVVINDKSLHSAIAKYGLSSDMVRIVEPGIDLDRFSPQRKISEDPLSFGLKRDTFVVGVVSRIRESRRLDIPLKAMQALSETYPHLQMLLVGRGRQGAVEKTVAKPARDMGIFDRVVMPGYCYGDRLVAAYRAMDVLIYPMPGSDQSCRTVREAMAAGVPVIAPRIGFLPELIDEHETGRLMDLSWESLVQILRELIPDKFKLCEMGSRSTERAVQRFSPALQAEKTLNFYHKLLERRKTNKPAGFEAGGQK
jgi:glycosyltransferase involved in cell wall biosynthesis